MYVTANLIEMRQCIRIISWKRSRLVGVVGALHLSGFNRTTTQVNSPCSIPRFPTSITTRIPYDLRATHMVYQVGYNNMLVCILTRHACLRTLYQRQMINAREHDQQSQIWCLRKKRIWFGVTITDL
jgi:hypothetical protein